MGRSEMARIIRVETGVERRVFRWQFSINSTLGEGKHAHLKQLQQEFAEALGIDVPPEILGNSILPGQCPKIHLGQGVLLSNRKSVERMLTHCSRFVLPRSQVSSPRPSMYGMSYIGDMHVYNYS